MLRGSHGGLHRGAADQAVEGLTLPIPAGSRVFVDDTYFRAESSPYAVSAIRNALSDAGYALASTKAEADAVFELRAGALSLEQMRRGFGLPEYRTVSATGPAHQPVFVVSVGAAGREAEGMGDTRRAAEQAAAEAWLAEVEPR